MNMVVISTFLSLVQMELPQDYHKGGDPQLKDKLLEKYSGYISTLKHEFSKHKKKGKLPRDARQILLHWWDLHYKWPYPTVNHCNFISFHGLVFNKSN